MLKSRVNGLFANVPESDWNDWKWQVRNRIETLEDLKKYQEAVVIVGNGVEELLHAVGILGNVAVIFGTGSHALSGGILGDGAGVGGNGGEHEPEGAGGAGLAGTIADVMTHDGTAKDGGDIHLTL